MTTREKFIVGVMCLTIVYGAYELLGARRSRNNPPALKTIAATDLRGFVAEVTEKLAGEKVAKEYQYMIAQAGAPWPKDPFLQSAEALKPSLTPPEASTAATKTELPPDLIYTGFLSMGTTKLAIINGLEYTEGEALSIDDYYIKTIFPNRVVIARIDTPGIIQLPIKEMDFEFGN